MHFIEHFFLLLNLFKLFSTKAYSGLSTSTPKVKVCTQYVLDQMKFAAGRLYVSKYFNNQSKTAVSLIFQCIFLNVTYKLFFWIVLNSKALEMISYIQKEFKSILNNTDWMDRRSKENALAKVSFLIYN